MIVEVPGYRLAEPLGAGATGVVYAGVRLADGEAVAVKVVHPELVDSQYRDRLRREAQLAEAVVHPGVVRVHEVGGERDQAWLAMDRLSGPDLQQLLDSDGPFSVSRAVELLADVADAVDAVHRAGVIHRDLKPANIILHDGRPMVADFGVARQLASVESTTGLDLSGDAWLHSGTPSGPSLGAMAGTVAYMAPEQWRGDPVTPATDVYALGGTLYALLTGHRPYERRTLPELAYAVAMLPPPTTGNEQYDEVVRRAMAKDPADRYSTAAGFANALRGAGGGSRSGVRWGRRRVVAVAAAGVAVLGVGIVAGTVLSQGGPVEQLTVCAEDATVRDAPRSRTVVATVYRGDRLTPVAPRDGASWVQVRLPDGRTGWSLTEYVRHSC
ncbi:serine/threonine protein kinase [Kribbella albertanoniae]|uniref:serine/threonine protein kinase n=1 Tax=Kribbella albertanoniae TaxID=1266829 RepID=UPI001404ED48|nr:serine/threonine protein kinase [Kribbella albertanoniae]